jgi:ribosomal protein S18 acetylase RimI-like enzyme
LFRVNIPDLSPLDPLIYRTAGDSDLRILQSELNPDAWRRLAVWMDLSCTRSSWITLNLRRGALVQALVLLTHSSYGIPVECVRLPGQPIEGSVDCRLFRLAIDCAKKCGARELFYSAEQDLSHSARIDGLGFSHWRAVYRYESGGPFISAVDGYRTAEAGAFSHAEIVSLIEQTSSFCDDSQTRYFQSSLGSYGDAKLTLETMELASHEASWWLVALGPDGQMVGLILPVLNYGELTIGFIGVLPVFRGRGIASYLLNQFLSIANRSGYSAISAEVDERNKSMQRAVLKSGFRLVRRKQEWRLTI